MNTVFFVFSIYSVLLFFIQCTPYTVLYIYNFFCHYQINRKLFVELTGPLSPYIIQYIDTDDERGCDKPIMRIQLTLKMLLVFSLNY